MAEEQGLEVSLDGFNKCMEQQRERSRVIDFPFCPSYATPLPPLTTLHCLPSRFAKLHPCDLCHDLLHTWLALL